MESSPGVAAAIDSIPETLPRHPFGAFQVTAERAADTISFRSGSRCCWIACEDAAARSGAFASGAVTVERAQVTDGRSVLRIEGFKHSNLKTGAHNERDRHLTSKRRLASGSVSDDYNPPQFQSSCSAALAIRSAVVRRHGRRLFVLVIERTHSQ